MSDWPKVDDTELQAMECQLQSKRLLLADEERNRLLFACGREAGRFDARRVTRNWVTAAACLGIVAGCWAMSALGDRLSATRPQQGTDTLGPATAEVRGPSTPDAAGTATVPADRPAVRQQGPEMRSDSRLTVGTPIERALALLDAPSPVIEFNGPPDDGSTHEPLRATSPFFD